MKACSARLEPSRLSSLILPPPSLILRDSATGSTSDFDSEDEGSTPSPAATIQPEEIQIGGFNLEVQPVFKVNNDRGLMRSIRSTPNAEPRAVASGYYGQQ